MRGRPITILFTDAQGRPSSEPGTVTGWPTRCCAIAIQQNLQTYGRDNADRRIRVRIGLHHGEAVHRDGTLYGQAVHAASRVMSEAVGGQILVTAAVPASVAATGTFSFVDRGLYWLRGFPDRWRLYEAERGRDDAGGAIGPVQTPFVGRERERADLRRAVEADAAGCGSWPATASRTRARRRTCPSPR